MRTSSINNRDWNRETCKGVRTACHRWQSVETGDTFCVPLRTYGKHHEDDGSISVKTSGGRWAVPNMKMRYIGVGVCFVKGFGDVHWPETVIPHPDHEPKPVVDTFEIDNRNV